MRINRYLTSVVAMLALGISAGRIASAQDSTPTKGDLEALQAQTIILKAKLAKAKVAGDLAATGKTGMASVDADTTSFDAPPVVSEVYGAPGHLKATFLYSDGTSVPGYAGSRIAGGCVVLNVKLDAVRIRCHGHTTDVGFSGTAPAARKPVNEGQQVTQGPFPMPSFPMAAPMAPGVSDAH